MSAEDPFIGGKDAALRNKINQQQKEILELKAANAQLEAALAAGAQPEKGTKSKRPPLEDRKVTSTSDGFLTEAKNEIDRLKKELVLVQSQCQAATRERDEAVSQLEAVVVEAAEREGVFRSMMRRSVEELRASVRQLEGEKKEILAAAGSSSSKVPAVSAQDDARVRALVADIRERLAAFEEQRPPRTRAAPVHQQDAQSQPGTLASSIGEVATAENATRQQQSRKRLQTGNVAPSVASTSDNTIPSKKLRTEGKTNTVDNSSKTSAAPAQAMVRPLPSQPQRPAEKVQGVVHFGNDVIEDFLRLLRTVATNSHAAARLSAELLKHVGGKTRAADLIVDYVVAKATGLGHSNLRSLVQELDSLDLFPQVANAFLWKWALACKPEAAFINHNQQWESVGVFLRHWCGKRAVPAAAHVILYDAIVIFLREWHVAERQNATAPNEREENATLHELLTFARGLFSKDDQVDSLNGAHPQIVPSSQIAARYVIGRLVSSQSARMPVIVPIFRDVCDAKGWPWHSISRTTHELLAVMADLYLAAKSTDTAVDILHGMRLLIVFGGFELLEVVRAAWAKNPSPSYDSRRTDRGFAKLVAMLLIDFNVNDMTDSIAAPYFSVLRDFLSSLKPPGAVKSKVVQQLSPDEIFVAQVLLVVGSSPPTTPDKVELLEQVSVWARVHDVGTALMEQDKLPRPADGWGSLPRDRRTMLSTPMMQEILEAARSVLS